MTRVSQRPSLVFYRNPVVVPCDTFLFQLIIATTVGLLVYSLKSKDEESEKTSKQDSSSLPELELLNTIELPAVPGNEGGSSFRCARFHPSDANVLYTVVNTIPPKSAKKNAPKRSYICKWDVAMWKVAKYRKVSDRALTCFDVRYVYMLCMPSNAYWVKDPCHWQTNTY